MPGNRHALSCPRCGASWPEDPAGISGRDSCPHCGQRVRIEIFPAWNRDSTAGAAADPVVDPGENVCFFHAGKRAVVPCDQCGRFLCALCDVELDGRHFCPNCLHTGVQKGAVTALEQSRTRWDIAVWWLLVLPLILCGGLPMPLTAPAAFVFSLLKYRSSPSLVAHSRRWLRAAGVAAVIEFGLGIALWVGMSFG